MYPCTRGFTSSAPRIDTPIPFPYFILLTRLSAIRTSQLVQGCIQHSLQLTPYSWWYLILYIYYHTSISVIFTLLLLSNPTQGIAGVTTEHTYCGVAHCQGH